MRLTKTAESDYQNIIVWTLRKFEDLQARIYVFTLHVARGGYSGRHFVLFRVGPDQHKRHIEVLRLLHDAMDLTQHIPGA